jgi:thioredoxin reductase (NADPH)
MDALTGAGIYYGASITEVTSCRNQPAYIVGAGNSAGQAAIYLSGYASKVVLVVRGDSLAAKMSSYLVERIETIPNIEVILEAEVSAVIGSDHLESITIRSFKTSTEETLPASGLFIFIGAIPCTKWLEGAIKLDEHGFIMTGPRLMDNGKRPQGWMPDRDPFLLETSVPGIFAVGDVRSNSVKRVASAVGEGSIAVQFVHQYLSEGR